MNVENLQDFVDAARKTVYFSLENCISLIVASHNSLIHPDLPHGPVCQRVQHQLPPGAGPRLPGLHSPLLRLLQRLHRAEPGGTDHSGQMLSESSRGQLSGIHVIWLFLKIGGGGLKTVNLSCMFNR